MLGALMVIGPYLFCYDPGFNSPEGEPEEMGKAMHLCIASGTIAIGNAVLLGVRYLNQEYKIFGWRSLWLVIISVVVWMSCLPKNIVNPFVFKLNCSTNNDDNILIG